MLITSVILEPTTDAVKSRGVLAHLTEEDWNNWKNLPFGSNYSSISTLKHSIRRLLILGWLQNYKGDLDAVSRELGIKKASLQREMHKLQITKNLVGDYE